jgi:antirestriction protein ArdC
LPNRERFTTPENYYATALHELTHWTGHESRLNRQFGKRFGDDAYAFEELVAELGAAFTVGQLGMVDATIEAHASYLDSWIKVLQSDKRAIFTAASQAAKASDFILQACLEPAE